MNGYVYVLLAGFLSGSGLTLFFSMLGRVFRLGYKVFTHV